MSEALRGETPIDLNALVARALHAEDPVVELEALAALPELAAEDRAAVAAVDRDGFRVASLLVKKLRFERITLGDRSLAEEFERDPAAFVGAFRRYAAAVPAAHFFPEAEARAFLSWRAACASPPGSR